MSPEECVKKFKALLSDELIFCDVGARWGLEAPWGSFRDVLSVVGFEPDPEEYALLTKTMRKQDKVYPYALSRGKKERLLNLTRSRGCSSFYQPNYNLLKSYPEMDRFQVEASVKVETTSLDGLYEDRILSDADFLKIDVQGAELDILKGAERLVRQNVLGLQVEVEFQPLYEGQPLFADVDTFIRTQLGLQIYDLRKTYWKYSEGVNIGSPKGQMVFGDALYFRDPRELGTWCSRLGKEEASRKLRMACVMGVVYGYLDYSLCVLNQPFAADLLTKDALWAWRDVIKKYGRASRYRGKGASRLSAFFHLLGRWCQSTRGGWASVGHHLGSRKKFGVFY